MQVPEVFQIMLGKKGQLADGIAEIIHAIVTGQQTLPGSDSLQAVPAGQLLLAGAAPADSQAQSLAAGEVPTDKSARKDYCLTTEHPFLGYIARPLNGIWATAPYLHNGSVPSLYDLLLPQEQRPATFYTGSHEFDPSRVGYLTAPGPDNAFLFDTHLEGNSNAGHDFAREYDESQRLALLEYLKTL
ncbi:di-heme-cytochrome C peroxidase [Pseudomonas aeruginosa]